MKDKDDICNKACQNFDKNSVVSVKYDYTERVQRHGRELGKRLVGAREKGEYARLKYDKLVIQGQIYKYDEVTNEIVRIGGNKGHYQPIRHEWEKRVSDPGYLDQSDGEGTSESGA